MKQPDVLRISVLVRVRSKCAGRDPHARVTSDTAHPCDIPLLYELTLRL